MTRFGRFLRSERGGTAAEFALVLPVMVLLSLGGIGLGTMMYANTTLHFATEDAARCASVRATLCGNSSDLTTYATGKYKGPALTDLKFILTPAAAGTCGNKVVGQGTYKLNTGLAPITVTMQATACYPA